MFAICLIHCQAISLHGLVESAQIRTPCQQEVTCPDLRASDWSEPVSVWFQSLSRPGGNRGCAVPAGCNPHIQDTFGCCIFPRSIMFFLGHRYLLWKFFNSRFYRVKLAWVYTTSIRYINFFSCRWMPAFKQSDITSFHIRNTVLTAEFCSTYIVLDVASGLTTIRNIANLTLEPRVMLAFFAKFVERLRYALVH